MTTDRTEPLRLTRTERKALAAVLAGAKSVRAVADAMGVASSSTAYTVLFRLRGLGLVAWDEGRSGTLRPAVKVVR